MVVLPFCNVTVAPCEIGYGDETHLPGSQKEALVCAYFRGRQVRSVCRYTGRRRDTPCQRVARPPFLIRLGKADRSSLLVSTALGSTLLVGSLLAPTQAAAQVNCLTGNPGSPAPITYSSATDPIICVNTEPRTNGAGDAINLSTTGDGHYIDLYNSGLLTASQDGIDTITEGDNSYIAIDNRGGSSAGRDGIFARTFGSASGVYSNNGIAIDNRGAIIAGSNGIFAETIGSATGAYSNTGISIDNWGSTALIKAFG